MDANKFELKVINQYSYEIAAGIGGLMPLLDENFSGEPVPRTIIEETIQSDYHDQLVVIARQPLRVIGSAALSIIRGSGVLQISGEMNRKAQFEDFVVDDAYRGLGAADLLWDGMVSWCQSKRATKLVFESEDYRRAAHKFYLRKGAKKLEGASSFDFEVPLAGT